MRPIMNSFVLVMNAVLAAQYFNHLSQDQINILTNERQAE